MWYTNNLERQLAGVIFMKTLYIGKQFSDDPAGRYYTDGDGSGEEFREEILRFLFGNVSGKGKVVINIDENVEGYGSSFLVEAFAGLVKHGYFSREFIKDHLFLEYSDPDFDFYKNKIYQYLDQADYNSETYVSTKEMAIKDKKFKGVIDKDFLKELLN